VLFTRLIWRPRYNKGQTPTENRSISELYLRVPRHAANVSGDVASNLSSSFAVDVNLRYS